jgi:NAD+ dependent glucose-6-phosphate dehydrogenase
VLDRTSRRRDVKKRSSILITGAAGNIGTKLRRALSDDYELTLLDRKPGGDRAIGRADLSVFDEGWAGCFRDVSTVVHLAADPHTGATWKSLIPDNIDALANVCRAAVQHGVERLVFTSSCHTMCGYRDRMPPRITIDMPPFPGCDYGVSKVIGEWILKSLHRDHDLQVVCLRIGWVPRMAIVPEEITDPWNRSVWLSERDLVQVVRCSIETRGIGYEVVNAMSDNSGSPWDLSRTGEVLSYHPRDGISSAP